jgi:hypothetical protein
MALMEDCVLRRLMSPLPRLSHNVGQDEELFKGTYHCSHSVTGKSPMQILRRFQCIVVQAKATMYASGC